MLGYIVRGGQYSLGYNVRGTLYPRLYCPGGQYKGGQYILRHRSDRTGRTVHGATDGPPPRTIHGHHPWSLSVTYGPPFVDKYVNLFELTIKRKIRKMIYELRNISVPYFSRQSMSGEYIDQQI